MTIGSFGGARITRRATGAITALRAITYADAQVTVAGAAVLGIAETNAAIGADLSIVVTDTAVWESGAAITPGAKLTSNALGQCVIASVGNEVTARALTAATAAGQPVQILFAREGILT